MPGFVDIPIGPGVFYEFEAGGFFDKTFVFTNPAQSLVRAYIVWQPDLPGWLIHISDRSEFRLIHSTEALASLLRKVTEHKLPVWWWREGDPIIGYLFPNTVNPTKLPDSGMAPR
jgi:hypothetical protein